MLLHLFHKFLHSYFCTVQQVLALMVDLEEEENWSIQDTEDDEDTDSLVFLL